MESQLGPGSMGPGGDDAAKAMLASIQSHFDADDDAELSRLHQSDIDDDDEDMDETLVERLVGLTEMFPDTLRNVVSGVAGATWYSSKWLFSAGRIGVWVLASSAAILAMPVMFENERTQMEEHQLQQQRQMLLGPNVALSPGLAHSGMPPLPQVTPPGR